MVKKLGSISETPVWLEKGCERTLRLDFRLSQLFPLTFYTLMHINEKLKCPLSPKKALKLMMARPKN